MKIAMIGHKRIPSREGWVEVVVEELSVRMAELGHTVHAYNRAGKYVHGQENKSRKLKTYKGIKLINIPTIPKKGIDALLYSFFAVIRALFGRYDVIHFHAQGPSAMILIARLFGIRTVSTVHGLDWQRAKWGGFAGKYLKFGEKVIARRANEAIVLSRNNQKYFLETYNRKTNFIPNGVNKPEIREASVIVEKYGLHGRDYILFLARLVPEKGLDYLIEAYKQIKTDKKLVIAGGGSHSDEYVRKIKDETATDSRIIMTGFVQGEVLEELFGNCSVYVLPSDIEGMPLSLLEAMSYGCTCLVSDIPENTEVTEDYATAFKKSDPYELKEKLEMLLSEGFNKYTRDEISDFIVRKYDWNHIVSQYLELYKKKEMI
jgi:glycosyltransferase involved in cell wall biosynthesis